MDRPLLRVRLTERARRGWERTAAEEGTTLTALFEAMGLELADRRWAPSQRVIRRAREIDRDRRSR